MILAVEPNIRQFQHYHTGKLILSDRKSAIQPFITVIFLYSNHAVLSKYMKIYVSCLHLQQ